VIKVARSATDGVAASVMASRGTAERSSSQPICSIIVDVDGVLMQAPLMPLRTAVALGVSDAGSRE